MSSALTNLGFTSSDGVLFGVLAVCLVMVAFGGILGQIGYYALIVMLIAAICAWTADKFPSL